MSTRPSYRTDRSQRGLRRTCSGVQRLLTTALLSFSARERCGSRACVDSESARCRLASRSRFLLVQRQTPAHASEPSVHTTSPAERDATRTLTARPLRPRRQPPRIIHQDVRPHALKTNQTPDARSPILSIVRLSLRCSALASAETLASRTPSRRWTPPLCRPPRALTAEREASSTVHTAEGAWSSSARPWSSFPATVRLSPVFFSAFRGVSE